MRLEFFRTGILDLTYVNPKMLHLIFDSLSHKPQQQGYEALLISIACTDSLLFESVPDHRQPSLSTVQDGFRLLNVKLFLFF